MVSRASTIHRVKFKLIFGEYDGQIVCFFLILAPLPLYMESVDDALSLCDEDVPLHIKIHLEWNSENKDR